MEVLSRPSLDARRLLLHAALVSIALYATLAFARVPGKGTAIWLATGLQIGFMLRMPRAGSIASVAVYFLLTVIAIFCARPQHPALTIGWPALNSLGVWLTASLLSRDPDWVAGRSERLRSWLRFTLIGGLLMPALWGLCGAAMLAALPGVHFSMPGFTQTAIGRFVNNALSIFVLVPMVLRFEDMATLRRPGKLFEAAVTLTGFAVLVGLVFRHGSILPLFILPLPVVVLLFRLEFVGTVACMVILSFGAIGVTLSQQGPFMVMANGDWPLALLLAQGYLMLIFATIVLLTGLLAERHAMAERAIELATESARMKSSFLAKMSHEIRTPLNSIIGFAELMRGDPGLSAANAQNVRIINESGHHLLALVNEVLDMAKVEAGRLELDLEDMHLPAFLEGVVAMASVRAVRKGLTLTLDAQPDLPPYIRADELKLRQVFLNLLDNAIKFTERGTVMLQVSFFPPASSAGQGRLQAKVTDTGAGIAQDDIERIFVAFQQGHAGRSARGGTGLGLAISKSFVERMGGSLSVSSEPGKGSCFAFDVKVDLAASSSASASPAPKHEARGLARGQRNTMVLIVDDIEDNRLLLARLLEKLGIASATAANGQEAVDLFPTLRPDLILMDMVMPVMRGDTAAERIRALDAGREVKIVCVTASAFGGGRSPDDIQVFDEVAIKPFGERQLIETLHRHLGLEFADSVVQEEPQGPESAAAGLAGLFDAVEKDWRQGFHADVISGDLERLQHRLDSLSEAHVELRRRLQALLDQLDLRSLARLIDPSERPARAAARLDEHG